MLAPLERDKLVREFVEVVSVEPVGDDRFRSDMPDWGGQAVFGGVILGQAVRAATLTIDDDKRVHSLHAYFIRPVMSARPWEIQVERVRDGRSLTTRRLLAFQNGKEVFSMTCSFYGVGSGFDYEMPLDPSIPDPESLDSRHRFGAVEMRDVGATPPEPDGVHSSTGRLWIRVVGPVPEDRHLQASMLAHMSDMTWTSGRPPSLGRVDHVEGLISLDHALWFHRQVRPDEWLLYDIHVLIHTGGRGMMRGTMHTQDGKLAMSMAQEMLIRPI